MKELNRFATESNGETVEVVVFETEKGIVVSVNGQTMDVTVNNEVYYSKFDKEEYKYILPKLRGFVEKHLDGNTIEKKSGLVCMALTIHGNEYWAEIPTPKSKKKVMLLINWLNHPDKMMDLEGYELETGKQELKQLQTSIQEMGYDLKYTHDGNEYDHFYGLQVPLEDFNEEKISAALNLWEQYNNKTDKLIDELS